MAKARRGEIQLEAIIHHIQSFLSGKEAARTAILSKTWYSAWLTRPNLEFEFNQRTYGSAASIAKKTIETLETLNLKIQSLKLSIGGDCCYNVGRCCRFPIVNDLIIGAMRLGAADLNIEVRPGAALLDLPHEILESETLIRLSVIGCHLHRGKVNCSKLRHLSLHLVTLVGNLIWDIYSNCPLIEKLHFSFCNIKLQNFYFFGLLPLGPYSEIEFGEPYVGSAVDGPVYTCYEFHQLKCLILESLDIDTSFFLDFSTKFPSLKDLNIDHCLHSKSIQLSSHSLECLSFTERNMHSASLDVPNLRKFTFSGANFPSLSFKAASRKWESNVSIEYDNRIDSWFLKLGNFLNHLSSSKISLLLKFVSMSHDFTLVQLLPQPIDAGVGGVHLLPRPLVENVMLYVLDPSSALLDGLLWCCRPKFIIGNHPSSYDDGLFLRLLWGTFSPERNERNAICRSNWLDLVEPNAEIFELSLAEWQHLPWTHLLLLSHLPNYKGEIRKLRWGQSILHSHDA